MDTPLLDGIRKEAVSPVTLGVLTGMGIGGTAGAIIDKNKRWRGALIGAGLGGGVGYGIGSRLVPKLEGVPQKPITQVPPIVKSEAQKQSIKKELAQRLAKQRAESQETITLAQKEILRKLDKMDTTQDTRIEEVLRHGKDLLDKFKRDHGWRL